MKKTIIQLDQSIIRELGKTNSAVYEMNGSWVVECQEGDEEDARAIIENAGWEITDESSFCGSEYDGTAFIIK